MVSLTAMGGVGAPFLPPDVLIKLRDADWFIRFVKSQYMYSCEYAGLIPLMSDASLLDAHHQWRDDMDRIRKYELNDNSDPDHFTQAGGLTYWLRRGHAVYDLKNM